MSSSTAYLTSNTAENDKGEQVGAEFNTAGQDKVEVLVAVQVGNVVGDAVVAERHRKPDAEEDQGAYADGRHPSGHNRN